MLDPQVEETFLAFSKQFALKEAFDAGSILSGKDLYSDIVAASCGSSHNRYPTFE